MSAADPGTAIPAQDCRLMLETSGFDRHLKFSRQFRVLNKNADLKIHVNMNSKIFSNLERTKSIPAGSTPEVFHLDIFNPSNAPISIALNNVPMQILANDDRGPRDANEGPVRELKMQIEGGPFVTQNPALGKIISISAMSHLSVSYQLPFPTACIFVESWMSPDLIHLSNDAMWARTLSNLNVLQLANPAIDGLQFQPEFYKSYSQVEGGVLPTAYRSTERGGNIHCD